MPGAEGGENGKELQMVQMATGFLWEVTEMFWI